MKCGASAGLLRHPCELEAGHVGAHIGSEYGRKDYSASLADVDALKAEFAAELKQLRERVRALESKP